VSALSSFGVDAKVNVKQEINLFSESFSRAILEVKNDKEFEKIADRFGIVYDKIGFVSSQDIFRVNSIKKDMNTLKNDYFNTFKDLIQSDL